jgi:hypothetical protein
MVLYLGGNGFEHYDKSSDRARLRRLAKNARQRKKHAEKKAAEQNEQQPSSTELGQPSMPILKEGN